MINRSEEEEISNRLELVELISKLPVKQRVVVALRAAGYTQEECGKILGVTRAAIGFSYKRAVRRMRQLAGYFETDDERA